MTRTRTTQTILGPVLKPESEPEPQSKTEPESDTNPESEPVSHTDLNPKHEQ